MSLPHDTAPLVSVKFSGAVLVCGDCEERSSGPKKLRAREVRKELKHSLGDARFKLRVVESSCLGLCPKKAMALMAIGAKVQPLAAEVRNEADVSAFASHLTTSFR
ncbi:hypothetical protein ACSFA8_18600 [Variovorax sp. RT4R15]|uniref:hypothetical protein n=1 Tax=Variovorax sp. RT4R15 TaxID=3443737 RepID=UPI003F4746A3